MSVLKFNIRVALVALAMLGASSQVALAETIFLKCGESTFSVDLKKGTVDNTPANITPLAIDWANVNQYGDIHIHIDRAAGTLTESGTYHTQSGDIPMPPPAPVTCTKSSATSTKF
jgi:hypothetical protein